MDSIKNVSECKVKSTQYKKKAQIKLSKTKRENVNVDSRVKGTYEGF